MSNLSDLLPSGAGGKSFDFVASGTLANGQAVGLTSDGKVTAISAQISSNVEFAPRADYIWSAYDTQNNKVIVGYIEANTNNNLEVVVGTVSGGTITFGTVTEPDGTNTHSALFAVLYDSSQNKVVTVSAGTGSDSVPGYVFVGTVSGTSITWGSKLTFASPYVQEAGACFDATSNKVIIVWKDGNNNDYGTSIVGTTSGNSMSFGSNVVFNSAASSDNAVIHDPSKNRLCLAYRSVSGPGHARIGIVSGTSITWGNTYTFEAQSTVDPRWAYDSTNQLPVLVWRSDPSGSEAKVSAGVIHSSLSYFDSFYNASIFTSGSLYSMTIIPPTFYTSQGKTAVLYRESNNSLILKLVTYVAGETFPMSVGSAVTINPASGQNSNYASAVYDPDAQVVANNFRNGSDSNKGNTNLFDAAAITSSSFVGITEAAISNTATGTVTLQGGINTTAITNTATTTFAITVANPGSGNRYYIDGALQATVSLSEGRTYKFDQSDGTNGGHPLRFSTTSDGTHGGGSEYTTGVTVVGVPGNAGAYTQIVVAIGAPTLYYYCTVHSGMGGTANTPDDARFTVGSTYYVQNDGTLGTGSTSIVAGEALSATSINLVNT